jgi:uncharacterized protein
MKQYFILCISFFVSLPLLSQPGKNMKWFNEPVQWKINNSSVVLSTDPQTDFWRTTFYKYIKDNGHFYFQEKEGDFECSVKITGSFAELYDQAGLMIRIDSSQWIKSGVEFANGTINISTVFTRTFSDWSVIPLKEVPASVWLKLVRKNDSIELSYSLDGKIYNMQRLGYFSPKVKAKIGIMAAAPDGKGFSVTFDNFALKLIK